MTNCATVSQQNASSCQMSNAWKAAGAKREDGVVCTAIVLLTFLTCL